MLKYKTYNASTKLKNRRMAILTLTIQSKICGGCLHGSVNIISLRTFLKLYLDTNDFEYSDFAIIAKWKDRSITQSACFRDRKIYIGFRN